MAVFSYRAVDLDSSAASGTIIADTPRQARDLLRERGLTVSHIEPLAKGAKRGLRAIGSGGRNQAEVVAFVRELATLLGAGIHLLEALQVLCRQHRGRFRSVLQQLTDHVSAGLSLADAMAAQTAYFDEMCVSIIRVGENTGSLETALKRLADFKEKALGLRSRVTTALIYPAFVCIVGVAVTVFLMTYVVPNLLGTLTQAGKELPAVTKVVQTASVFLTSWWWAILVVLAGLALGVSLVLRSEKGHILFDRLALRIPLLGELIRMENTSRMSVVLSALLSSGLQFVEAVRITRETLRNRLFRQALLECEQAVTAGRDLAGPLEASGVFSPMVVQIVAVGQRAGQLEEMLVQLSEAYDQQIATATQRLTAVLEPLLIVILALMVGFVAFATILPILEVSNVL